MIDPFDVSAVIVTRGNVPLHDIVLSLPYGQVLIWDNAKRDHDLGVYGRYAAIRECDRDVIYVQDDDALCRNHDALCAAYAPGTIVANMPAERWDDYPDSALVGWGTVFDRDLPERAFRAWADAGHSTADDRFLLDPDVIFTTLTPHVKLDLGVRHLPWAKTDGRMFRMPDHTARRNETLRMARAVRDGAAVAC